MIKLIYDSLTNAVLNFSAEMPFSKSLSLETDGTEGTWYISPFQHALEFIFSFILCAYLTYLGFKALLSNKNPYVKQTQIYQNLNKKITFLEGVATFAVIVSYFFMFLHKYQRGQLSYVVQLCHFHLGLLLITLLSPKKWFLTHLIYNLELYAIYGTVLALLLPDTRGISLFFEMGNFYLEHYLLLLVPFVMMFSGRYATWNLNLPTFLLALSSKLALVMLYSTPVALKLGTNLNYALSPPPGILETPGPYFKLAMIVLTMIFSLISRIIIVESGSLTIMFVYKLGYLLNTNKEEKTE